MNCPICHRETAGTVRINNGYTARECPDCDFLMTDAEASPLRVNEETYRLKERVLIYSLREKEFERRYDGILGLLRRHAHVGSLLEVGSNIGVFADLARRRGIRVDSVEPNEECRAYQRLAYRIDAVADLAALAGRTYDAIVLMDVLEHIPDAVDYLARLKEFLAEDGVIFLQFPNRNSWASRFSGERWAWWAAPDHLFHFSGKAVRRAAEKTGYRVALLRYVGPLMDELAGVPVLGRLVSRLLLPPARILARWVNTNPLLPLAGGSLIQALLRKDGNPIPAFPIHRVS